MTKTVRKKKSSPISAKSQSAEAAKQLQKKMMREEFIAQGGYDGRYKTKVVTDKRKSLSRTQLKAEIKKTIPGS